MTGYVRVDTGNNIADGNVISADDLDNEFDGVVAAFNASTGHTHGGAAGEGAPITKVGPTQDVTVTSTLMAPKTTNTVDLGSTTLRYKNLFLSASASIAGTLNVTGVATLGAGAILNTPASVTLTNATGLPISTGVSGLGAGVASFLATALGTGVATFLATPNSTNLRSAVTDETGTGSLVFSTSPVLVTPNLGTPSALVGTNITGTAAGLTAGNVTTNANLTGAVTSVGNATSLGSFTSAQLAGALTDETGTGSAVFSTSPTLVTPNLGTPSALVGTNITGTASGLSIGGNSATATALQTARTIGGVSFNGTANINLPGVNIAGNQNTTGTATNATNVTLTASATASAFKVPFANTTVSTTGNYGLLQDSAAEFTYNPSTNVLTVGTVSGALSGNATTATTLQTARTIGMSGVTATATSFNGSANIIIPVTAVPATLLTGTIADARISGSYTGMTNLTGTGTVDFSRFLGNATDTALLPSLSWTTDPNTGIWSPGADQVGITTGGVNRLTVNTTAITSTLAITAPTFNGALSGNASTATALQTARTIGGVSFNGTANINLPGVNIAGNQSTTGNAATATTSTNVSGGTASVTTLTTSGAVTLNGGTANGVAYLNGSKVLTSGSALTFDGTVLSTTGYFSFGSSGNLLYQSSASTASMRVGTTSAFFAFASVSGTPMFDGPSGEMIFGTSSSERMRLTSTGLGIGTASPGYRLDIAAADTTAGFGYAARIRANATAGAGSLQFTDGPVTAQYGVITGSSTEFKLVADGRPMTFYTGGTERARIDNNGALLLGTTALLPNNLSSGKIQSYNSAGGHGASFLTNATSGFAAGAFSRNGNNGAVCEFLWNTATTVGSVSVTSSSTTYNTSSDYRLKNVIGAVSGAGERIDALEPIEYEWKSDGSRTRGFLAHKFQEVYAGSVTGTKDAVDKEGKPVYQAMQASSSEVIADLVAEIQSLRQRLAAAGI